MFFTVYTPTYNRADLLPRVYASLLAQEDQDFEWLIIDDGSTDDTAALVQGWINKPQPFPIRYIHQANQGRYMATNKAISLASGEMFVTVDSDDWLTDDALRAIRTAWENIPDNLRSRCASVAGLFLDPEGRCITKRFPESASYCSTVEMEYLHGVSGDIAISTLTRVRREFPFPEHLGRYCMPSLIWNRIATKYLTCFINQPLQYKEYQAQGITRGGMARKIQQSPESFRIKSREFLELPFDIPRKHRKHAMRLFIRASRHAGLSLRQQFAETRHKALWLLQLRAGLRDFNNDLKSLASTR